MIQGRGQPWPGWRGSPPRIPAGLAGGRAGPPERWRAGLAGPRAARTEGWADTADGTAGPAQQEKHFNATKDVPPGRIRTDNPEPDQWPRDKYVKQCAMKICTVYTPQK